ncbi:hypothetical protein IFO70_22140 [Phormidium tenue FACHB-886]|nr:hypothetical protein [Phormidium tenue FACHB-886]
MLGFKTRCKAFEVVEKAERFQVLPLASTQYRLHLHIAVEVEALFSGSVLKSLDGDVTLIDLRPATTSEFLRWIL